ncbi:restriction endonuclease subunit S [Microbacterium sp. BH-3-3-3]|uniref:restriction endonuclease subunit S n=1 Tax=Microbacterium sp. BH-3-3-3 TaxID=1906742 RepID=UPI00119EDFDA|nr:restriction endonuclease subunit S [Microbacterium sp. BH-3-3-3]
MLLADVCSARTGLTMRERLADTRPGGTLAVQQGDITAKGTFRSESAVRIAAPDQSSHRVLANELVFRSRGPFWSAWAPGDYPEPIVAVAPLFILTPTPEAHAQYLAWHIGRPTAQSYFRSVAAGTNVQMIALGALLRLPIDLPPLDTQTAIVAAAELADRERDLARHVAELKYDALAAGLDRRSKALTHTPTGRNDR